MKNMVSAHNKQPRIRKGDFVIVIAGADSARDKNDSHILRRVLEVYPKTNRILVEGVNVRKRSYRKNANPDLPQGGIHEKTLPIHISNVMLVDPKDKVPTRVGVRTEKAADGSVRRVRYAKHSGNDLND